MQFYSGFSLKNDKQFFKTYLKNSHYCVAGFSYGAIKALEYTKKQIKNSKRVDTLQLFSPAFFHTQSDKYKKLQMRGFQKNQQQYIDNFIDRCFLPYQKKELQHSEVSLAELEELLYYEWNIATLIELVQKGVAIEVYIGLEDKIIDVDGVRDFFISVATITSIKDANHFLQCK